MSRVIDTAGLGTVINEFDVRGQALLALIVQYIPGFVGRYYGFRQIGSADAISFPAVFVEPVTQNTAMVSTGKYELKITYNVWVFAIDNNAADCLTLITSCMESLVKLLSNNALGDIATNYTRKFKNYYPFWTDSEFSQVEISRAFVDAVPQNQGRFMRVGMMRFDIEDVVIK